MVAPQRRIYVPEIKFTKLGSQIAQSINVPHEDNEVSFVFPLIGSGNYEPLGKRILSLGYKVATGDHIASLLHSAYCNPLTCHNQIFDNVRRIFNGNDSLHIYNIDYYTPKGIYAIMDFNSEGINCPINEKNLEKLLIRGKEFHGIRFSSDNTVRFAPVGSYQLGQLTDVSNDGQIVINFGIDGAKKIAEVSEQFRQPLFMIGFEEMNDKENIPYTAVCNIGGLEFLLPCMYSPGTLPKCACFSEELLECFQYSVARV